MNEYISFQSPVKHHCVGYLAFGKYKFAVYFTTR